MPDGIGDAGCAITYTPNFWSEIKSKPVTLKDKEITMCKFQIFRPSAGTAHRTLTSFMHEHHT